MVSTILHTPPCCHTRIAGGRELGARSGMRFGAGCCGGGRSTLPAIVLEDDAPGVSCGGCNPGRLDTNVSVCSSVIPFAPNSQQGITMWPAGAISAW